MATITDHYRPPVTTVAPVQTAVTMPQGRQVVLQNVTAAQAQPKKHF